MVPVTREGKGESEWNEERSHPGVRSNPENKKEFLCVFCMCICLLFWNKGKKKTRRLAGLICLLKSIIWEKYEIASFSRFLTYFCIQNSPKQKVKKFIYRVLTWIAHCSVILGLFQNPAKSMDSCVCRNDTNTILIK